MSSEVSGLKSATFHGDGYEHVVELVHQRDDHARRSLIALQVEVREAGGGLLATLPVDPREEILDVANLTRPHVGGRGLVMVTFDARYDPRILPYRPHHYAYLHRRGSGAPSLYYAVNAVLGGVPDRVGATTANNLENYLFLRRPLEERYSLLVGNVAHWATAKARVLAYYAGRPRTLDLTLEPGAHAELALPAEQDGARLERVDMKTTFRLATYVVGRRADSGDMVLFDHLFPYFK
jgi:hypothetical protein